MKKKKRERLRNNILFFIAVATPAIGIMWFIYETKIEIIEQQFEMEKAELKVKIASIERNIGDNKYFDVRSFFPSNSANSNEHSHYIMKGNFYADTTSQSWSYRNLSPVSYIGSELKINPIQLQLGRKYSPVIDSIFVNRDFRNYIKNYRFHEWIYTDSIRLKNKDSEDFLNSSISVFILKKDVAEMILNTLKSNINSDKMLLDLLDLDSISVNEIITNVKNQYNESSSGLIFSLFIHTIVYNSLLSGDLVELQKVQKKSNVFYSKYRKEYKNEEQTVYQTGELFFAEKNDNIYMVSIKILEEQPLISMEQAADVNAWLHSLKFLESS
ncbi:MAG: hypothetical protein HC819_22785 [Cyclobacteriaceae bacterium]|nr:hypothetical protein [Cyclobacteriaceae bacterium]